MKTYLGTSRIAERLFSSPLGYCAVSVLKSYRSVRGTYCLQHQDKIVFILARNLRSYNHQCGPLKSHSAEGTLRTVSHNMIPSERVAFSYYCMFIEGYKKLRDFRA